LEFAGGKSAMSALRPIADVVPRKVPEADVRQG
jgi:hypothetical protein